MAKLKDLKVFQRNRKTEQTFEYVAKVNVTATGEFQIQLHPDIVDSAYALCKLGEWFQVISVSYKNVKKSNNIDYHFAYGKEMKNLERFLYAVIDEHLKSTREAERIICYRAENSVKFWQSADGEIFPNGSLDKNSDHPDSYWYKNKEYGRGYGRDFGAQSFSIGLAVSIEDRVTHTDSKGNKRIEYDRVSTKDLPDGSFASRLAAFQGLDANPKNSDFLEVPFTEENAKYFHDFIMGMCNMARKMDQFFKEPENVMKAIAEKSQFLIGVSK